jgi:hypothetical protein
MFVSIHIPKTAGTALAKIFDDTSLRRIMYDYGTERDLEKARTCLPEVREHSDFIESYFRYLHGHFHYLKYADVFPDSPFITTVRHPVDRVISQYRHILRSGDRNNWRHKMIMDGEMNVVEFSKFEFIGNAQWHYLEGREIEDYEFIFVQEYLSHSLSKFCERFDVPEIVEYLGWFGGVPKVNEKPRFLRRSRSAKITADDKQKIYNNCERDVDVYRRAKECLKVV